VAPAALVRPPESVLVGSNIFEIAWNNTVRLSHKIQQEPEQPTSTHKPDTHKTDTHKPDTHKPYTHKPGAHMSDTHMSEDAACDIKNNCFHLDIAKLMCTGQNVRMTVIAQNPHQLQQFRDDIIVAIIPVGVMHIKSSSCTIDATIPDPEKKGHTCTNRIHLVAIGSSPCPHCVDGGENP
jgi:hypothetical protein